MSDAPEDLLRGLAPQVLGSLLRRFGTAQFDLCENAVQEALLAAYQQWPDRGRPTDPRAWLVATARRRVIDQIRAEVRRRRREANEIQLAHPLADAGGAQSADDSLAVLRLCCHPALSPSAQVALTLRAVSGLTTAQIARAHLVPEPTMAQRISRAKARIRDGGGGRFPEPAGAGDGAVLDVLYLMFNEGHTATTGDSLHDTDLTREAIRLTREVHRLQPDHAEAAGLLALMLLTDARRDARTTPAGRLIPLDEQDRSRWDRGDIAEGIAILEGALNAGPAGPFVLQAAIAALHAEASSVEATDWTEVLVLYKLLEAATASPVVTLNRAVAEAMVHGPAAGLAAVDQLDGRLPPGHHRLLAVRAHLEERAGHPDAACDLYRRAARGTLSTPERDYLLTRAQHLRPGPGSGGLPGTPP